MILWGSLTRRRSRGPCKTLARQVAGVTSDFPVGTVGELNTGRSDSVASVIAEGAMVTFPFTDEEALGTGEICGGRCLNKERTPTRCYKDLDRHCLRWRSCR